jgi:autotransporter-associated beta strand protein
MIPVSSLTVLPALAAIALLAFTAAPGPAATLSTSLTPPVVDGEDLANLGAPSGTDKWWAASTGNSETRGQTFTTGDSAVRLKAITYHIENTNATPTKTYRVRLGKVSGTVFTQVHAETAVQNGHWNANEYMTWTLDTPVLLEPYTTYGIDVTMLTSTTAWQTGIPYITTTDDEYPGGLRYSATTAADGVTATTQLLNSDRVFHLDIERPLAAAFALVATSPPDNAADALANRPLILTFSQNVTPGTGDLTVHNLTDATAVVIPATDPRLTFDRNVVRIAPAGVLGWSKHHAIHIAAGAILGEGGAAFAGIADDSTWNFTTIAADPLLAALAAIKGHVNNTFPLTGAQISAHKTAIDNNRQRFAENTTIINAAFDLIATYDAAKGPLFVSGFANNATSFDRNVTTGTAKNSVSPENYHWVIYTVMQHAMDLIYTGDNLAKYEATLTNYKFGSHTSFPGPCSPPANPANTHSVQINGSFPVTFGRDTQHWTWPARKPTGTYLAPGTIASVTVPAALVNAGYKIRVGAHAWDLSGRRPVNRLERATRLYAINSTTTKVASPYGGGIYIEVPIGANAGVVSVSVTGSVRSPYFSAKSFHQTTATEWTTERTHPAPWADFQSEKFMCQVPRKWIYNMTGAQATQLMVDWDMAMDAINDLMGFPRDRGKETMYCQTDVILRSSVHAPGYPAVNVTSNVNSEVSPAGYAGNYLVRGPNVSLTAANIEFHEQGHAYGFPKFGGETESNVNLLQPAMLNRKFGRTFDQAQNGSFGGGNTFITMDTTAIAWMCVFSFSPNEIPMQQLEKQYQHKGHAKWMDIARLFGWEKLDAYWRSFMLDDAANISYGTGTDDLLLRLSRSCGADIRPLFHFWGIHPQNPSALAAAIAAENIPASTAIRDQLLHYKSIVPANNAAFRSFCMSWWGRKPTVAGAWEETDHAMQWDETLDADGTNNPSVRPTITTGSMYVEGCAAEIRNRTQELIDLYFPSGLSPAEMSFASAPTAVDATTIGLTATTATAVNGPVEYYFENTTNTTNTTNSGWLTTAVWQQSGLVPGQTYSFRVKARDALGEETAWSPAAAAPLTAAGDVTPPAPSPMTFATPPYAVNENTITMTATTATDVNGVEYFFECVAGGDHDSGWQTSPVYTDTSLAPVTEYTYRVRARDKSANQNSTTFSAPASANTADLPDEAPPQFAALAPANGALVADLGTHLVITFDEPVIAGSGSVTLKNLTDGSEAVFNLTDPAVAVAGNSLTLNPPANLLFGKTYAVRISDGAVADAANNPFTGIDDDSTWSFTAILADPLAIPGGPYLVPLGDSLALNGGASHPSHGETIVAYAWDLDNDGTFGDVTGATPAPISQADLLATWGMQLGQNTIGLKITDSNGKTATASTTVKIGANLTWDANGTTAGQTDGAGAWLNPNQWRDDGGNAAWTPGAVANFGNGGAGGAVTLAAPTSVASLVFNAFTGTYTLGTAGQSITLTNGILKNEGSGTATFASPLILGAPQTWLNHAGSLTTADNATIDNGGHRVTIDGTGLTNLQRGIISGTGGFIKNGTGRFILGGNPAAAHTFSGDLVLNGGVTLIGGVDRMGTGNLTLNGGVLEFYWSYTLTRTLGSGPGQIQVLGGASGFSENGSTGGTVRFNNSNSYEVVWGSQYFKPATLILQASSAQNSSSFTFDNPLNLNGETRTIFTSATTGTAAGSATLARVVRNTQPTPAGLVKTGSGRLNLNAANTYDGGTTLAEGTLQLGSATALGAATGTLTVHGGLLNLNNQTIAVGNLTGTGGTIANNGSAARTLTIGTGNATGGIYQGVLADNTNAGTGSLALTKTGTGTLTLAGPNTHTGATAITGGTLVLTGATQATTAITVAANSALGLVIGSPVTAASAAVDLTTGAVAVTGTAAAPVHTLLTAQSITGTPVLATPIPGYELAVIGGTELRLVATVTATAYQTWAAANAPASPPTGDFDNDGVPNAVEFVLGGLATTHDLARLPTVSASAGKQVLSFVRAQESIEDTASVAIEVGSNLVDWPETFTVGATTGASSAGVTVTKDSPVAGQDTVTLELAPAARRFARLKVTIAP